MHTGRTILLISLFTFFWLSLAADEDKMSAGEYINTYKQLAINEMHRVGIPASITLAQGLLESGNGNSRLATEGKNHFGIKCHKGWDGLTIHEDDDLKDECFRKYDRVEDSYRDHSDFLTGRYRYRFLFDLERTDYKGWAHGLKKAGYATNPQYAYALIKLIEKYDLHQYDFAPPRQDFIVDSEVDDQEPEVYHKEIFFTNRIKTVYLQPGETLADVAERYDKRLRRLKRYNEIGYSTGMTAGMKIFLQPKRRKGDIPYHIVQEGETLYEISQMYGIRMRMLYKRNQLEEGQEPGVNERLYLRKYRDEPVKVRENTPGEEKEQEKAKGSSQEAVAKESNEVIREVREDIAENYRELRGDIESTEEQEKEAQKVEDDEEAAEEKVKEKEETVKPAKEEDRTPKYLYIPVEGADDDTTGTESHMPVEPEEQPERQDHTPVYYEVQEGDTLYSISRKFDTTVEQIRDWNNLADNTLKIGDRIVVGINK